MFEIKIVGVEGIDADCNQLGCYFNVNGKLFDVVTPLRETEDTGVLVEESYLKLVVKKMTSDNKAIGSVSFHTQILPEAGHQWLPIHSDMNKDALNELPTEVRGARMLLLVNPSKKTETQDWDTQRASSDLNLSGVKHQAVIQDLNHQLQTAQDLVSFERKQREYLKTKLEEQKSTYEESLKNLRDRENNLKDLIDQKDQKCFELMSKVNELESELLKVKNSKERSQDKSEEYFLLKQENEFMKAKIEELQNSVTQTPEASKTKEEDLDLALERYLNSIGLENCFVKVQKNYYKFGNQKLWLFLKQGEILCKVGTAYKKLSEFFKPDALSNKTNKPKPVHRRAKTTLVNSVPLYQDSENIFSHSPLKKPKDIEAFKPKKSSKASKRIPFR